MGGDSHTYRLSDLKRHGFRHGSRDHMSLALCGLAGRRRFTRGATRMARHGNIGTADTYAHNLSAVSCFSIHQQ